MSEKRTFVVVGANVAGGRAVETLRSEGFDGRVVLVGAEPDRPYERPPLSKEVLRSEGEPVFLRDKSWYQEHDVELRLGETVNALYASGSVSIGDESIAFDACLLATGARVRTLPVAGIDLAGVHYLRTLREAHTLAGLFAAKPRVVVIGAGFIGAEVAASARTLGCDVTMIEVFETPLERVLGKELGAIYTGIHRDHGVDLRLKETVDRIEGDGRAEAVFGSSGNRYPADLVVVGVGVEPNAELASAAGLATDNGIAVDEFCRTSAPNVYAAGDVANTNGIRVEHFQNAQNQGVAAAKNMLGRDEPFDEVPWFWSDQYDVNLQTLGHPSPDLDRVVRGSFDDRNFIAFSMRGPHVAAAVAMNRGRDIAASRRLIERSIAVDPTQLADDDVPLKELLSGSR